jgi:DEAD/DEAH box helicase domain-containing protein
MTRTPYSDLSPESLSPETLKSTFPDYDDQLRHTETRPARESDFGDASSVLPDEIVAELDNELYSHQATAIEALQNDENVTVATSTSSGKTWIYTLYFAALKQQNPDARALFLYPTKALSADQVTAVNDLLTDVGCDARAEAYDGDTKSGRKPVIRDTSDIIVSNFSGMNHYLPNHMKWRDVFENCELVVIDESHTYTGVHGMNVAWVIRRLRRMLDYYGADPQVVCSTATIGNPGEHSSKLTGLDFTVVTEDGSPRGKREIAFWEPPIDEDEDELAGIEEIPEMRKSAGNEAAKMTAHLGLNDIQTLTFTRSRQGTEVGAKQAGQAAGDHPSRGYLDTDPYHAGLSKKKRRAAEHNLKSGKTDAVLSTSALELGIDIGSVDATVLTGYPGTRQSFWQQIGRAGRGTSDSLSVYVPRSDSIDQYILDHPEYLLGDNIEDAVIDLSNNSVFAYHVLCASDEHPLTRDDAKWFGPESRLERAVSVWNDAGKMTGDLDRGAQYNGPPRPQSMIDIYATTDEQYDVRCRNGDIDMEPIQKERAYRDYHPGALKMYDGDQYEVTEIVEDRHRPYIEVQRVNVMEYTKTMNEKHIHDLDEKKRVDLGNGFSLHAGMGTVDIHYTRFKRMDVDTGKQIGNIETIDLPPVSLRTQLMWVELPDDLMETVYDQIDYGRSLEPDDEVLLSEKEFTFAGGLHGAEHGMIKMSPLALQLDSSDMGGLSTLNHPELGGAGWFIHDAVDGGVGFSHSIYEHFEEIASKTDTRVSDCNCEYLDGCPSCLMSSQCGNNNDPLHKQATTLILEEILAQLASDDDSDASA